MRKSSCAAIGILLIFFVLTSCNDELATHKGSAPIPVFLSQAASRMAFVAEADETQDWTEAEAYTMYKFTGGPALIGFDSVSEESEIPVAILGSATTLTWEESNGVYTYRTDNSNKEIALEIKYDTGTQTYDYIQAVIGSAYGMDCYIVTTASDVTYNEETRSWDGEYKAYIAQRNNDSTPYYFNNIPFGFYHSGNDVTGIFTYKLWHKSPLSGDIDDGIDRTFDLDSFLEMDDYDGIETARKLINKMESVYTTMTEFSYQIIYTQAGRYNIYPPKDSTNNSASELRKSCLEHTTEISKGWVIPESSVPEPVNGEALHPGQQL